jgi:hypothetical protein
MKLNLLKVPRIRIEWTEPQKVPVTISVRKLKNGYLIGEVYIATEERLIEELVKYVKDPYANLDLPEYKD